MKVTFENVGRNKKTWTAETEKLSESWVLSQIRKSKALMSNDISFDIEGNVGRIYAGFRPVGSISIEEAVPYLAR